MATTSGSQLTQAAQAYAQSMAAHYSTEEQGYGLGQARQDEDQVPQAQEQIDRTRKALARGISNFISTPSTLPLSSRILNANGIVDLELQEVIESPEDREQAKLALDIQMFADEHPDGISRDELEDFMGELIQRGSFQTKKEVLSGLKTNPDMRNLLLSLAVQEFVDHHIDGIDSWDTVNEFIRDLVQVGFCDNEENAVDALQRNVQFNILSDDIPDSDYDSVDPLEDGDDQLALNKALLKKINGLEVTEEESELLIDDLKRAAATLADALQGYSYERALNLGEVSQEFLDEETVEIWAARKDAHIALAQNIAANFTCHPQCFQTALNILDEALAKTVEEQYRGELSQSLIDSAESILVENFIAENGQNLTLDLYLQFTARLVELRTSSSADQAHLAIQNHPAFTPEMRQVLKDETRGIEIASFFERHGDGIDLERLRSLVDLLLDKELCSTEQDAKLAIRNSPEFKALMTNLQEEGVDPDEVEVSADVDAFVKRQQGSSEAPLDLASAADQLIAANKAKATQLDLYLTTEA